MLPLALTSLETLLAVFMAASRISPRQPVSSHLGGQRRWRGSASGGPCTQVVDFTEFREMMLAAEPNILINRQQSLVPRSSGASAATLSPRSSSRSSQDCVNQALVQPLSLRADLHQGSAELAARRAALPEVRTLNASWKLCMWRLLACSGPLPTHLRAIRALRLPTPSFLSSRHSAMCKPAARFSRPRCMLA